MQDKVRAFLTIFLLELEDLKKDIELLIERYRLEHDQSVISDYVFSENVALMYNELFGIDSYENEVRQIRPEEFADVERLAEHLSSRMLQRCKQKGIAMAAYVLTERKIKKVLTYIDHEQKSAVGA